MNLTGRRVFVLGLLAVCWMLAVPAAAQVESARVRIDGMT